MLIRLPSIALALTLFAFGLLADSPAVQAQNALVPDGPAAGRFDQPAPAAEKPEPTSEKQKARKPKLGEKVLFEKASEEPEKPASGKAEFRAIAKRYAKQKGVPYELVDAVMRVESNYSPGARGGDGEFGIMQVMPPTARQLGYSGEPSGLSDPETNIRLGTTYLAEAWRRSGGDICTAVMKYRAGWGETRFSSLSVRYCVRVREHLAAIGYPVTGDVPEPTFGFKRDEFHQGVRLGSIAARKRLATGKKLKSRAKWSDYDQRMRALDAAGNISLGL